MGCGASQDSSSGSTGFTTNGGAPSAPPMTQVGAFGVSRAQPIQPGVGASVHPAPGQLCSFLQTGTTFQEQRYVECHTCSPDGLFAVCLMCAHACHVGHRMSEVKQARMTCDCVEESCKARGKPQPQPPPPPPPPPQAVQNAALMPEPTVQPTPTRVKQQVETPVVASAPTPTQTEPREEETKPKQPAAAATEKAAKPAEKAKSVEKVEEPTKKEEPAKKAEPIVMPKAVAHAIVIEPPKVVPPVDESVNQERFTRDVTVLQNSDCLPLVQRIVKTMKEALYTVETIDESDLAGSDYSFLASTRKILWILTSGVWDMKGCVGCVATACAQGVDVVLIRQDGAMVSLDCITGIASLTLPNV